LNKFDFGILGVVCFQIGEKLFVVTGMDGCRNPVGSLCEHRQHAVVNKVVNQDNPLVNARIMRMLTPTAVSDFKTLLSIAIPLRVKA